MQTNNLTRITVEATVNAPAEKVWEYWTAPEHITRWYHASDDWHAPAAENDLRSGGKFKTVMASRDGKTSFDFEGVYDEVETQKSIIYTMSDGRSVTIRFTPEESGVRVTESFDAEDSHSAEVQRAGWQAILNNFKKYAEAGKD